MLMLTALSPVNLEKAVMVGGGSDPWLIDLESSQWLRG